MTAQPALADNVFELDTSRIYKHPPQPVPENPILDAPLDVADQPAIDATLPPAARAKRKAKAKAPSGKKRGRPATPKPEPAAESPAPLTAAPLPIATPPAGDALPNIRFSRVKVDTLILIVAAFLVFGAGIGTAYMLTGVGQ